MAKVVPATLDDIASVVELHLEAFPKFFLTALGPAFLRGYYKLILEYEDGILLVARRNDNVPIGFVAGFVMPERFYAELRKKRLSFALTCIPAIVRSPSIVVRLMLTARSTSRPDDSRHLGELSSLAVSPTHESQGLGRTLLYAFIDRCRDADCHRLRLTTDSHNNVRANRFYASAGWRLVQAYEKVPGRMVNEYSLDL